MAFDTSPEYLEEVRKEREQGEAEIKLKQTAQARKSRAPEPLQTTWGSTDSSTMGISSIPSKPTKIKTTRPNAADDLEVPALSLDDGAVLETISECMAIPAIPVEQDSLSVVRKMFPSSADTASGSVKWTQLVQALADAGIVATQAPGSAGTFASTSTGAINLHKPHEPTVDALMLRRIG